MDAPKRPTDHYSRHKVACEALVRESRLEWLIARLGVSLDPADPKFEAQALQTVLEVRPDNRLEFIHPADVADGFATALARDDVWGEVLHFGGGERCRMRHAEFVSAMFAAAGLGRVPPERFGERSYYTCWVDTDRAQELLGYQRRGFDDFIAELSGKLRFVRPLAVLGRPLARRLLLGPSRGVR